jgi:deoxycytidylate deaminase
MKILENIKVPTGNILIVQGDYDYMRIAWKNRLQATCVKKLGTILVSENKEYESDGYNGPPYIIGPCIEKYGKCPREGMKSGTNLHLCPAIHAEIKPILDFTVHGKSTTGSTLYCSFGVPCKDCMKTIIEAEIGRLVLVRQTFYDELSKQLLKDYQDSGGIVDILNVIQCPKCYSLNAEGFSTTKDGSVVRCSNCKSIYIKRDSEIHVGE